MAVKIMESIHEVIEEIEEEYLVLRDLAATHPNLPEFYGLFLKQDPQADDQLWFAIEVKWTSHLNRALSSHLDNHTLPLGVTQLVSYKLPLCVSHPINQTFPLIHSTIVVVAFSII